MSTIFHLTVPSHQILNWQATFCHNVSRLDNLKQTWLKITVHFFIYEFNVMCKKNKNIMVVKVECIYYLDGVWMQYKMSWSVFQQSTFWHGKSNVQRMKWSKGYCLLYVHVIKIIQTSHCIGMDFIFVSKQITVLFVLFFVLVGIVWLCLLPVTVNVMKWITASIVWVFWRYTWTLCLSPFLSLITLILCYVVM